MKIEIKLKKSHLLLGLLIAMIFTAGATVNIRDSMTIFHGDIDLQGNSIKNVGAPSGDGSVANVSWIKSRISSVGSGSKITTKWEEDSFNGNGYSASYDHTGSSGGTIELKPFKGASDETYSHDWRDRTNGEDESDTNGWRTYKTVKLDLTGINTIELYTSARTTYHGNDVEARIHNSNTGNTFLHTSDGSYYLDTTGSVRKEVDVSHLTGQTPLNLDFKYEDTSYGGTSGKYSWETHLPTKQGEAVITPEGKNFEKIVSWSYATWYKKQQPESSSVKIDVLNQDDSVHKSDISRSTDISGLPSDKDMKFRVRFKTDDAALDPSIDLLAVNGAY